MCQVLYNNLVTPLLGISQYKHKHTHTLRYIKNAESSIVLKSVFTYSLRILLNVVLMMFFLLIPSRSSLLPQKFQEKKFLFFFMFLYQGLTSQPLQIQGSLCRPEWPEIHIDLLASCPRDHSYHILVKNVAALVQKVCLRLN